MRQRIVGVVSSPEFWLACLLLWLLGSAGRSLGTPWMCAAATEALRWCAGIGLVLALGYWRRGSDTMAKLIVVLLAALALLGIADGVRPDQGGMVGPYHDHQLYGSVLLVLLPLAAALALTARETLWRLGSLAVLAAGTLCLLLSQTRSAWAGLLTAAVVFGWLWFRQAGLPMRQRRTAVLSAVLSAVVLLVGIAAVWMLVGTASLRVPMTDRAATVASLGRDGSWQARLTAWRGARDLIEANLLTGIGLGLYPKSQQAWTHQGRPLGTTTRPSLSEEAHNFYLQTAAETGLIGLGLYLAALAACAAQGVRCLSACSRRTAPTGSEAVVIAALSALAGQAVDAFASPSWQFGEASLFFWAILGLGRMALLQEGTSPVPLSLPPPARGQQVFPQVAAGLAFVALTAEVLPIGLLTPVEAYTHAANIVFQNAVINRVTANCPAGYYCFSMTANYSDGSSQDVTFDNGAPIAASFNCTRVPQGACAGTIGTGALRNQYHPSASDLNYTVQIKGSFSDNARIVPASAVTFKP